MWMRWGVCGQAGGGLGTRIQNRVAFWSTFRMVLKHWSTWSWVQVTWPDCSGYGLLHDSMTEAPLPERRATPAALPPANARKGAPHRQRSRWLALTDLAHLPLMDRLRPDAPRSAVERE